MSGAVLGYVRQYAGKSARARSAARVPRTFGLWDRRIKDGAIYSIRTGVRLKTADKVVVSVVGKTRPEK
ncbi:MAG TPA: hypothetical protein VF776_05455 [Sphingomicrobium sp.]